MHPDVISQTCAKAGYSRTQDSFDHYSINPMSFRHINKLIILKGLLLKLSLAKHIQSITGESVTFEFILRLQFTAFVNLTSRDGDHGDTCVRIVGYPAMFISIPIHPIVHGVTAHK
jgi:hypothetical protein